MQLIPEILAWQDEFSQIRRQIHQHELGFEESAIPFGASLWARLVETYLSEI